MGFPGLVTGDYGLLRPPDSRFVSEFVGTNPRDTQGVYAFTVRPPLFVKPKHLLAK